MTSATSAVHFKAWRVIELMQLLSVFDSRTFRRESEGKLNQHQIWEAQKGQRTKSTNLKFNAADGLLTFNAIPNFLITFISMHYASTDAHYMVTIQL